MAPEPPLSRVPQASQASLSERAYLLLVRVLTMRPDASGSEATAGNGGGVELPDSAEAAVGPVVLKVTLWWDREPDIEYDPLPPWLAAAALYRASVLMEDMAEADLDVEEEEEED